MVTSKKIKEDLYINEGTTFPLIIEVVNDDGSPKDLTGFRALFTTNKGLEKECEIQQNAIILNLEPVETLIQNSRYQVRLFGQGEVRQAVEGAIFISKAVKPYTEYPE